MRSEPHSTVGLYESPHDAEALEEAVTEGHVPVAVYGLGKMGLPLAAVFAEVTGETVGVDIDPDVVAAINRGECPVEREPGLPEAIATSVDEGALTATADPETAARQARVHVVIVPTLVEDGEPDLSSLRAAAEAIGTGLSDGDLVCVESTVPPGTCRDVVAPILDARTDDDTEYGLAFCPERTASGRALRDIRGAYPKVVGGIDEESTAAAALLYDQVTDNDVETVSDATTAECVKVFEGVYRDVNIALANELARTADELAVDVTEAITTANTQPFCDIHRPGPGVGGHCIPYYPYFLIEWLETPTPLLRTARSVNDSMPAYVVRKVQEGLRAAGTEPDSATVAVLGIAYRAGVNETRESPGLAIADLLQEVGVDVYGVDPIVDLTAHDVRPLGIDELPETDVDAVVLVTDHEEFDTISWESLADAVVIDGRNAVDPESVPGEVYTIGIGDSSG